MAQRTQVITRAKFLRISRYIKDQKSKNIYNAVRIAKHFNVSRETVSNIQRTGTWPKFEAAKAARRKHAAEREKQALGGRKLNVTLNGQNIPSVPVDLGGRQLPLTPAPKKYVSIELTREEYREIISLKERVEALEAWRQRNLQAEKALIALQTAEKPKRRGLWRR